MKCSEMFRLYAKNDDPFASFYSVLQMNCPFFVRIILHPTDMQCWLFQDYLANEVLNPVLYRRWSCSRISALSDGLLWYIELV